MTNRIDGVAQMDRTRFLKVQEVATLLRLSRMSVYRLVHAGEIEAVRFGRTIRIPERAVTEYLRTAFFKVG
ncbi:MAG: helix-turn-helix domain-containing protein [Propionibacteriaceae bacterium]|nr:helix-turn-helix domain-containing protein [Micropruina sp.]HBX81652.1 transcriptional regulator [Propionibacteriaceae bacterium]HBY24250.1 transcriptional regulator [Propionibacteriaceae bacterium]